MLARMHLRRSLSSVAFVAAFVLNPAYFAGCSAAIDRGFQFDGDDMAKFARAASDSFEFTDAGAHYRLDLAVTPEAKKAQVSPRPSALARSAYACGTRKLYATAAACIDYSTMGVRGSLALFRIDGTKDKTVIADTPANGDVYVYSRELSSGAMTLAFEGGTVALSSDDGKSFVLTRITSNAVSWTKAD
jgi:hypothetical protein